ncbi:molybdopterin biosynthesis protein [Staphylothermus hellenicus]|uniref:Molybdenum cofactor synthesis domain protein n=1 Tax=Staphylothermus hellenicus (strain DSM 12710 / JCM 10830 / BK20S6-10-b1 / P8) TaxID=591019 RepID=D7DC37_STAHD|nr:molybdopterin biosynthesis protein [Staphylothermus hellenicus]ADI31734.1 molybdenum cofactor synthesis domain protein [Staphylothermus hellenicus DSM 12710]
MERKIFHQLTGLNEVVKVVEKYYPLKPLGEEYVDLISSTGRVLAEDIYAPIDHPPFDRSEVDGYAVRSIDIRGADDLHPVKLRVIGGIEPGEKPSMEIRKGDAAEIATGAMIPRGADTVVMVEYTRGEKNEVEIYRAAAPGENIAFTGSDISMGDLVLLKGTIITPNIIGLLAGLGISKVKVYVKPKVAVFSTGNEVVEPGEKLVPGKVFDVNGYLITSSLNEMGVEAKFIGKLPDNEETIYSEIKKALTWADIVITSGGTSAGLGDVIYRVFEKLGEPGVIVHGLKTKPGKPTVIAVAGKKLLFGLPGFPLSCYMIFDQVVKPIMYKLLGTKPPRRRKIRARLAYRIKKPLGKTWLLPVSLIETRQGYTAYPVSIKSGSISPFIYSDGYVILPENTDLLLEDSVVETVLFRDLESLPKLVIIGSNDILLYHILVQYGLADQTRIISTGSMGGWRAIRRGEADIAPTHLLDEETLEYNAPFMEKFGLKSKAVLLRGYERRLGILVGKGNPKNITGIKDFLRNDIVIVNRTRGSGTRVYLDYILKKLAEKENLSLHDIVEKINGYTYEVKTHTAVAAAIAQGRADAGIAVEMAAKMYNLDFIPLTWEKYDFLILRDRMNKKLVREFIDILKSLREKKNEVQNKYPGYRIPNNIGEIIAE